MRCIPGTFASLQTNAAMNHQVFKCGLSHVLEPAVFSGLGFHSLAAVNTYKTHGQKLTLKN